MSSVRLSKMKSVDHGVKENSRKVSVLSVTKDNKKMVLGNATERLSANETKMKTLVFLNTSVFIAGAFDFDSLLQLCDLKPVLDSNHRLVSTRYLPPPGQHFHLCRQTTALAF